MGGGGPTFDFDKTSNEGRLLARESLKDQGKFDFFGAGNSQSDFYKSLNPEVLGKDYFERFRELGGELYIGKGEYQGQVKTAGGVDVTQIFSEYRKKLEELNQTKKSAAENSRRYMELVQTHPGRQQTILVGPGSSYSGTLLTGGGS